MNILGVTMAFKVSLLASRTVTPLAGAGASNVTASVTEWPIWTARLAGRAMVAVAVTVTAAVAFGMPVAPAVIVAAPAATPVTGTAMLFVPVGTVTDSGTAATPVLLELRVTLNPLAPAGGAIVSVRFCVLAPVIVRLDGVKLIAATGGPPEVTCTCTLVEGNPAADAVMRADPKSTPLTAGARLATVEPSGIKIFCGATVTFDGSLLVSIMNMPPEGAGISNVTGNGADWPGAVATFTGRTIGPTLATAIPSDKANKSVDNLR
jgi:hypothetical protein